MEIWKDIVGYEGMYQVSNLGRIKSFAWGKERIMANVPHTNGYLAIGLTKDSKKTRLLVHRVVAKAFISNPDNKETVNHIDGDKHNNAVDNLEWATVEENRKHAMETGLLDYDRKLSKEDIRFIVENYTPYHSEFSGKALASKFGVTSRHIRNIVSRGV